MRKNEISIQILFPISEDRVRFEIPTIYNLQAPDFRIGFPGEDEILQEYIEQTRRDIRRVYNEMGGALCEVKFSFEK